MAEGVNWVNVEGLAHLRLVLFYKILLMHFVTLVVLIVMIVHTIIVVKD